MTKYFFDVINGEGLMQDEEGVDLPNGDAVRAEVAKIAMDVAKIEMSDQNSVDVTVSVRDASNCKVFVGRLSFTTEWCA